MKLESFEAIVAALERAGVRYLVASGVVVNAHGHLRLTRAVDLVIRLVAENIAAAFAARASLGLRPLVPVTAQQFADPMQRERWMAEKDMKVLNCFSDLHRKTTVNVFVAELFDFERELGAALRAELAPGLVVPFVSIPTLIAMKQIANRPRDLDAMQHLRWILEDLEHRGTDS